jgi:hypothetical protein
MPMHEFDREKNAFESSFEVYGTIAIRPGTQDRKHERPITDPRKNYYTGQICPLLFDEEDDNG